MQMCIPLNAGSGIPLYQQIADGMKSQINTGDLGRVRRLPSTRQLADYLNVSRFTTTRAYEVLEREGFIVTQKGLGTFVRKPLSSAADFGPANLEGAVNLPVSISAFAERLEDVSLNQQAGLVQQRGYGVPESLLPLYRLNQIAGRHRMRNRMVSGKAESASRLGNDLRGVVKRQLNRWRGVRCENEQVFVFQNARSAFDLIARVLIDENDVVIVENPGDPIAREIFTAHGATLKSVDVDNKGMVVESLAGSSVNPKMICVTPSHQSPTGAIMPTVRRADLLKLANGKGSLILEDDFGCEFVYGQPIPSIQSMDQDGRVIYLASLSNVFAEDFEVAFVVVPPALVAAFNRAMRVVDGGITPLQADVIAEFLERDDLAKHVRRVKPVLARKRHEVIAAMLGTFQNLVRIMPGGSGTSLCLVFDDRMEYEKIENAGRLSALPMVSLDCCYTNDQSRGNVFLLSFAHLDESLIQSAVENFRSLLS